MRNYQDLVGKDELGLSHTLSLFSNKFSDLPSSVQNRLKKANAFGSSEQVNQALVLEPEFQIRTVRLDDTDTVIVLWVEVDTTVTKVGDFGGGPIEYHPKEIVSFVKLGKGEGAVEEAVEITRDVRRGIDLLAARELDGWG